MLNQIKDNGIHTILQNPNLNEYIFLFLNKYHIYSKFPILNRIINNDEVPNENDNIYIGHFIFYRV